MFKNEHDQDDAVIEEVPRVFLRGNLVKVFQGLYPIPA